MNSRERTLTALSFAEPDRAPVDCWLSSGMKAKLGIQSTGQYEAFLDAHDIDLRYIDGPVYTGPPLRIWGGGLDEDIWGVRRRLVEAPVGDGIEWYREVALSPLADARTVEEVDRYTHWPSPDWFDCSTIEAQCDAVHAKGRITVFVGDRLNRLAQLKPAMYLRGVERIFMDMAENPEVAAAIIARIRAFYLAYAERIFEAAHGKLDIVLTGDDFGSQQGPLVSPPMWEAFLGDGFAEYAALAKHYGIRVMHHTCGAVRPLIPLMMERGLDILQSLQPEAEGMVPAELKSAFGGTLAFHGSISIQRTMPFGSPEDIRREVAQRMETLGRSGGYILGTAHNIQADTPIENVEALFAAYATLGRYQ